MKLAFLSGKGGVGKTLMAVNLAAVAENATYIDCDVEEPNGRIFLKPKNIKHQQVSTLIPEFDKDSCIGCRKCVDFCKFNALIFIKEKPIIFPEICHSCGGCELVCPAGAVKENVHPIGHIEIGKHDNIDVITGILDEGEASGIPIIEAAQREGFKSQKDVFVDCPPGSACSVMESISSCDFCILVAEPTAFGFHNFKMVYELTVLLNKPCAVVINKQDDSFQPLEAFCKENNIAILAKIPYSKAVAETAAKGKLITECDEEIKSLFDDILNKIRGML